MKVLFSASNRRSSEILHSRILKELKKEFELRTCGYLNNTKLSKNVDYILDPLLINTNYRTKLKKIIKDNWTPACNYKIFLKLFSYVKKFSPDIIITDREPFLMAIAKTLNIKLFDISPINIYFAIEWGNNEYKYKNVLNSFIRDQYYLPKADEYFIYSPYYRFNIKLKKDFKWIKPYVEKMEGEEEYISLTYRDISKILKYCSIKETLSKAKTAYCTGETSLMSDLILNDIDNIHIMPNLSDPETLINAMVNRKVGLGQDLGQVELMQHMAVEEIESVKKKYWQTSFNKIEPLNLVETIKRYS